MVLLTKKNVQCEGCEVRFVGGNMRTVVQETTPQIALRNCSKEVGGKHICDFGEQGVHIIKFIFFA